LALGASKKVQDLFFDYGIRDKDIAWANADAKKMAKMLQDGK